MGEPENPTAFDQLPVVRQEQAWRAKFRHLAARWDYLRQ